MAEYFGTTVEDIIGTMEERFRPEKSEGVVMILGYDISGDGGGKWTIRVKDQKCNVKKGLDADCTVVMRMSAQNFVGLNVGKVDAVDLFTSGKVQMDGDMGAAGLSSKLFKRYATAGAEGAGELISLKCVPAINQRFPTGPIMAKFFEGLRQKKFIGIKCPKCGRVHIPPREVCADCRIRNTEFVELGPEGYLILIDYTYYASPDPLTGETRETPYGVAVVQLNGNVGKIETFVHLIKDSDLNKATFGTKVRPVWADKCVGNFKDLLYFEVAE